MQQGDKWVDIERSNVALQTVIEDANTNKTESLGKQPATPLETDSGCAKGCDCVGGEFEETTIDPWYSSWKEKSGYRYKHAFKRIVRYHKKDSYGVCDEKSNLALFVNDSRDGWTAREVRGAVVEVLKGVSTIEEAAARHRVEVAILEDWLGSFLGGGEEALRRRLVDRPPGR
jgi:hypothetical protein